MDKSKVIIVANRLPVTVQVKKNQWQLKESEGGLATGLSSVYQQNDNIWVGWPGAVVNDKALKIDLSNILENQRLKPIWLSRKEIEDFYEGFSNETLWPLFHYFPSYAKFDTSDWEAYKEVNQRFADMVLRYANENDTIWVHDYQLMLVPGMIREKMPEVNIGFFQHIPFPSYEIFRMIPWREDLLRGMLGSDLIGFHTYDDERHFLSSVFRILNVKSEGNEIIWEERSVLADAFPMGIDYEKYEQSALSPKTSRNKRKLEQIIGDRKLMISIDRLDYSKGILQRLLAYDAFLRQYPQMKEKVVFLQLIVPSRDKVPQYAELKEEVNRLVSEINGKYGTLSWQPISYFYRSFPLEMISALYASAHIAIISPLRDGMNLVCKEFVASKTDKTGVLILSEMAGASRELGEAVIINPQDKQQMVRAMYEAIMMPVEEQKKRMAGMQQTVQKFNIHHWVKNFMARLAEAKQKQKDLKAKLLNKPIQEEIKMAYGRAQRRLLFLDYDGTLSRFQTEPLKAAPDQDLLHLLQILIQDPKNTLIIISGRKKDTLEEWLGRLPIGMIAEHGVWVKNKTYGWHTASKELTDDWKEELLPILKNYEMRTPGAFIEEKSHSLVWHYRKTDKGLGERRATEITAVLKGLIGGKGLQILEGNKVIEVKSALINKGKAAREWLEGSDADFILAIGDDVTDEDTFKAMPEGAFTIKVGSGFSAASYYIRDVANTRSFLKSLSKSYDNDVKNDIMEHPCFMNQD